MPRKWTALLACFVLSLAASPALAQLQWTVTGTEVPQLAAVDQMVRARMLEFDIRAASVAIAQPAAAECGKAALPSGTKCPVDVLDASACRY